MGFDTYVTVGDRTLVDWRKQTDWIPRLFFERDDLVLDVDADGDVTTLRFETTASRCLETLEANGFGWHSTVVSYDGVRSSGLPQAMLLGTLASRAMSRGEDGEEHYTRIEDELDAAGRGASAQADLEALGTLWAAQWFDDDVEEVLLLGDLVWDEPMDLSSSFFFRAMEIAEAVGGQLFSLLRALIGIARLFAEARLVAWPIAACVLLRHLPADTPVVYELTEGIREFDIDSESAAAEFVDQYWEESGTGMADHADKIGVLYGTLAAIQTGLGRSFWLGRTASAMGRLDDLNSARTPANRKERGDALEDLVAALVETEAPELRLMVKNFRTEEEEIDLILANGLSNPFWSSFASPTIFIECKNWADPVGVQELRVFESKMEDRRAVAKIGIFVSMSGFTAPFMTRLKEIQARGVGVIFAVSGEDLRSLLVDRERLTDWLRDTGFMRAFGR